MKVYGVVLAGGASQRMTGQNKASLMLEGKSLLELCTNAASRQVDEVFISTSLETTTLASPLGGLIPDKYPQQGPLAAVLNCLERINQDREQSLVAFFPCDVPVYPSNLVGQLASMSEPGRPAYAVFKESNLYTFSVWPSACASRLLDFFNCGNRSLRSALLYFNAKKRIVSDHQEDERCFLNINTREDWEAFLRITNRISAEK